VDIDVVRKSPLFASLDDEAASALMGSMTASRLERGDVLFREGDRGERLYVIGEGKIKLGLTSIDGRENLLAILGPGEMFGELSLFDPGPRTATATAVAETQLIALGHEDLNAFLAGRPAVASTMLAALARRLRRTNEALSDLSNRFGRSSEDGILVAHDLTQEELAQLVGASRETVNKALADFATRGWIKLEARAVVLIDIDRIQRRSH